MRRALVLGLMIAAGPGCLCLQSPGGSGNEQAGGSGGAPGLHMPRGGFFPGGGGTGGTPIVDTEACVVLVPDGVPVGLEDDSGSDDGAASLIALDADTVGVAFTSTKDGGHVELRLAQFDGWKEWPPSSAGTVAIMTHKTPIGADAFAAGGSTDETFALFYRASTGGLYASEHAFGANIGTPHPIDDGDAPLFIRTSSEEAALVGYTRQVDDPVFQTVHTLGIAVDSAGSVPFRVSKAACSTTPIYADAVAVAGGTLFAAAVGQPLSLVPHADCGEIAGTVGASTSVALAKVSKLGASVSPGSILSAGGIVDRIALTPRGSGAWLVVGSAGTLGIGFADGSGYGAAPRQVAGPPEMTLDSGSFGAATLGEHLVIAVAGIRADGQRGLSVGIGGEAPAWVPTIDAPGIAPGSPITVLTDSKSQVLVAWAGESSSTRRIHVARFHCGP